MYMRDFNIIGVCYMQKEKKPKFKLYFILSITAVVLSLTLGAAFFAYIESTFSAPINFRLIIDGFALAVNDTSGYLLWSGLSLIAIVSIPVFFSLNKEFASKTPYALLGQKYDTKSDKKGAARWLTTSEINKLFPRYSFAEAAKHKVNGFVVQTIETKVATYANIKDEVHCLIIGTTGSGKTIRFVVPTMQFQARTAARPSVIVTDPKGELYFGQSKLYQEKGYDIVKINLRDPLNRSNCWNPCYIAYSLYQEGLKQKQLIKFHYDKSSDYAKTLKFVNDKNQYFEEWYEYNGYAFANLSDAVLEAERRGNSLKAKAMEAISDLTDTIYAESAKKAQDPFWVKSGSQLVEGLLLAMLEDSEIEELGITEQKFNLGTVSSTLSLRVDQLKSYFAVRDVNSYAKRKAQGSVNAPQSGTQESIISTAMADLSAFSDPDIQFITCNNDIDFKDIGRKPTAVFLIIPDEKENRHVFASLFISQAYKALVELANDHGGKVPHPVNFIVDEFANLPMIPGMENKITVARSRGLAFMLIIQSLSQLRAKYGPDVAEIIKTNCNMQVFLATNDNETAEYFSKVCGEKTIQEINSSQDSQSGRQNLSYSLGARALIKPEELLTLEEGVSIVKLLRAQPAKLKQMAFWKSRSFYQGQEVIDEPWNPDMFVFEQDGYFDIAQRNKHDAEYIQEPLEEYDLDLLRSDQESDEENFGDSSDEESGGGGGNAIDETRQEGEQSSDLEDISELDDHSTKDRDVDDFSSIFGKKENEIGDFSAEKDQEDVPDISSTKETVADLFEKTPDDDLVIRTNRKTEDDIINEKELEIQNDDISKLLDSNKDKKPEIENQRTREFNN